MRLSVGIPVYNEQQVIPELLTWLTRVLDAIPGGPHEMLVVDDGSADRSRALLIDAARRDRRQEPTPLRCSQHTTYRRQTKHNQI